MTEVRCPKCESTDCTWMEQEIEGYWCESIECHACGHYEETTPEDARRREAERESAHQWAMNERALEVMDRILFGPGWPE